MEMEEVHLSATDISIAIQKEWWHCPLDGIMEGLGVEESLESRHEMGGV
jgi:hypothetical protein